MILEIIGSAIAIFSFGIIMETPRKYLWTYAFMGAISGGAYLLCTFIFNDDLYGYLLSALLVTFVSNMLSKVLKVPTIVFLVAGILPVVPGSSVYRCVYHTIAMQNELALSYLIETLVYAGSIALGIFLGEGLNKVVFYRK